MYASGAAPGTAREPYAGFAQGAVTAQSDGAAVHPARAAASADADSITALPDRIADGAGPIPGSPMQGMLAVFGDFLRSAFEQLGQMLAGLFATGPGGAAYGAQSGAQAGGAQADAQPDAAPSDDAQADAPNPNPLGAVAGDGPPVDGANQTPQPGAGENAHGAHRHARLHAHEHVRGGHGARLRDASGEGILQPGQRLDLGQGESITRAGDGSLELRVQPALLPGSLL